jgi:hypothetical protein
VTHHIPTTRTLPNLLPVDSRLHAIRAADRGGLRVTLPTRGSSQPVQSETTNSASPHDAVLSHGTSLGASAASDAE